MANNVIMPALEMAQESGVLVRWLKREGEAVTKGEPLMEIETDKVTVEIEASASGILGGILVREGEAVPVGQTIAWILAPGETPPAAPALQAPTGRSPKRGAPNGSEPVPSASTARTAPPEASPLARRIAAEHRVDLSQVSSRGGRIEKSDVLAFLGEPVGPRPLVSAPEGLRAPAPGKVPASPKARKLASERGLDLRMISGSGPEGAVLTADVLSAAGSGRSEPVETPGTLWRRMAERVSASWTSVPHFYLVREVDAGSLIEWRKRVSPLVEKRSGVKPTFTDLFVKLIASALREHPRLNGAWGEDGIHWNEEINIGIATAVEEGLIVPVIHRADASSLSEIAARRQELVDRAKNRKLRPGDVGGGTFTLSNLGMYQVDAFNAIVNSPQAAILALGRISDRVVPVNGQPAVRPMVIMTLSCDHRIVDGARAAQFLEDLANLIEDPWRLLS